MPIYTKKGDRGRTCLFDSKTKRVDKDSLRIVAIGAVDELNSFIGLTASLSEDKEVKVLLKPTQRNLLTIGSSLAGSGLKFTKRETTKLEKLIDGWDKELPPLTNFILPGGSVVSSHLHCCRSLTRRAERRVVALSNTEDVSPQILMYMNRLSDFFFQMARKVNNDLNLEDETWAGGSAES